jgi:hypothetical protein
MPRQHIHEEKKNITRVIQKRILQGVNRTKKKTLQGGGKKNYRCRSKHANFTGGKDLFTLFYLTIPINHWCGSHQ